MADVLIADDEDEIAARLEREKTARVVERVGAEVSLAKEMASQPDAEEKAKEARRIAGTPVGFAKLVLGLVLYHWQVIVLTWFENTLELLKASLCTPNGAGKSERIVSVLALWWLAVHPQGMVVITTKDSKQLDNQIWPAIERHKGKFKTWDFIERMVRNNTGGFIIGFTTDDPGRAEGWHKINDFTGPLLIIGDEAKSIADPIHMALDRCTYNAKLLTSSPGLTEGLFYRSQSDLAAELYNGKGRLETDGPADRATGFKAMKVGLADCPHIPQSRIDNIVATYGPDHWFTRSTLHAEFTDADSDTIFVFSKHAVRSLMDNPPPYVHGGKRAFCDFAAGRAENTFTLKEGNRITQTCWRDPDPMRAIAEFIRLFIESDLRATEIYGDAGGMGIPILARFAELGWAINGVNNESPPIDASRYPNLGAECWHNGAIKVARRSVILPNDPILFQQLTSKRAAAVSDGLLGMETKRDQAKRGIPSPDRADGVVGVLAAETELANSLFDGTGLSRLETMARSGRAEMGALDLTGIVVAYERNARDSWLQVYERPVIGQSYLCLVNPATHGEPLMNHSVMVVKMGYFDTGQDRMIPTRLVAKVRKPLKLDPGPLARMVRNLAGWYGKALVVPITRHKPGSDRGDLIDALIGESLALYVRENTEVLRHGRMERLIYGWETDDYTRSQWIGALAEAIRKEELDVEDVDTVTQLHQLTAGNAERMRDAECLGVALKLANYSTVFAAEDRSSIPKFFADTPRKPRTDLPSSMIS